MKKQRRWLYAAVPLTAAFFSLLMLAQALWIPLKAELAQWLIERSWQQMLNGDTQSRPWPWADTRPVAVLTIPAHGIRQLVLEGEEPLGAILADYETRYASAPRGFFAVEAYELIADDLGEPVGT